MLQKTKVRSPKGPDGKTACAAFALKLQLGPVLCELVAYRGNVFNQLNYADGTKRIVLIEQGE